MSAPTVVRSRRPVAALLAGYAVSLVGSRLSMTALPLFVLATTGSATRTGLVAMAEAGPYVAAQALAGPVTDRVGTRRVSIVSDVASTAVVGAVPLLHHLDALSFGGLLVLLARCSVTVAGRTPRRVGPAAVTEQRGQRCKAPRTVTSSRAARVMLTTRRRVRGDTASL